jgi:hypothetical protein
MPWESQSQSGSEQPTNNPAKNPTPSSTSMQTGGGFDNLVSSLNIDPAAGSGVSVLRGYAGESDQAGHRRLYLSPALDSYVDIPDDAVVESREIPTDASPLGLGGTVVWVRKDADLLVKRMITRKVSGDFLEGAIASSSMGPATRGVGAADVGTAGLFDFTNFTRSVVFCTSRFVCVTTQCGTGTLC